uniref:hypothetical protein n=1 Tax=Acetatifactor sp. TaxID=1872090 RepID=UPI0040569155
MKQLLHFRENGGVAIVLKDMKELSYLCSNGKGSLTEYWNGTKTVDDVISVIQNRVQLYLNEIE